MDLRVNKSSPLNVSSELGFFEHKINNELCDYTIYEIHLGLLCNATTVTRHIIIHITYMYIYLYNIILCTCIHVYLPRELFQLYSSLIVPLCEQLSC